MPKWDFTEAFSEVFGTNFHNCEGVITSFHYVLVIAHSSFFAEEREKFSQLNARTWQDIEDEVLFEFQTWNDICFYVDSVFEEQLRVILGSRIYTWHKNDSGYCHLAIGGAANRIIDQERFPTLHLMFCDNMNESIIAESTIYPQKGVEYNCQFMAYQKIQDRRFIRKVEVI